MMQPEFGWIQVIRLGLIQACLGAVVVLTTSTLNRVMVVEMALPALIPGCLVALHYAVQILRPRMGYGSDTGGRRTPWIVGGMVVLTLGGLLAATATAMVDTHRATSIGILVFAFVLIGLGVSACGTSLLVLLATHVPTNRRAASATAVWIMMIAGFAVTAGIAGKLLDPFSPARLIAVAALISSVCLILTVFAIRNVEPQRPPEYACETELGKANFSEALKEVWADARTRRFTVFVFLSMLAYSAQDLILEPFAGSALGYTPGESTALSGLQHAGVLLGMIAVAVAGSARTNARLSSLKAWVVGGCLGSAIALMGLVFTGVSGSAILFRPAVFALGLANGAFAIAAVGSMMNFASLGVAHREGTRMGLWGAAQAIAFALGGVAGAGAADLMRLLVDDLGVAYASVFAAEALLFVGAAVLATHVWKSRGQGSFASKDQPSFAVSAMKGG
jgi:BCD family chlorophyll transporter-like MFS transporter